MTDQTMPSDEGSPAMAAPDDAGRREATPRPTGAAPVPGGLFPLLPDVVFRAVARSVEAKRVPTGRQ